jgi:hypothetical protein
MEITVRSGMCGRVLLSSKADNVQLLLQEVMIQLPQNRAVRFLQGGALLDPLSSDTKIRSEEDVNVVTDGTPLRTMTRIHKDPGDDYERPLKRRRLGEKSPEYFLWRPRGTPTDLHREPFFIACSDCNLVAHVCFTALDDWYLADSVPAGIFFPALCKSCQVKGRDEKQFVCHCARCEMPIWPDCCQDPNVRPQYPDNEVWCADCSMFYSGNFTGA